MEKQMTARFNSRCGKCGLGITADVTQILYTPGEKATHVDCPVGVKAVEPVAQTISVDEIGVYVMPDGSIVKVQPNKEKTRTYAKLWISDVTGERLTLSDQKVKGRYEFVGGLVGQVAAQGRRMSLDEAKAFILLFGQCARCARKLSAASSVEKGIGPVCIKYFADGTTAADLMGIREEATVEAGYRDNLSEFALVSEQEEEFAF